MLGLIKKLLLLVMILLAVFIGIVLFDGGEKVRSIGENVGGTIQEITEKVGDKADKYRKKIDEAKEEIGRWKRIRDEVLREE